MKMNYLLKNKPRRGELLKPIVGTVIILACIAAFSFFAPRFLNETFFSIGRPVWSMQAGVGDFFGNLFAGLKNAQTLRAQNDDLAQKLSEAETALQTLESYKQENEELKNLLGRSGNSKRIVASVLLSPSRSLYDTLTLDVGEDHDVTKGDLVLFGDFVIGTIRDVYAHSAKAVLFSSPGQTFTALIGNTHIQTEALGRGNGNFIARLPKEIDVQKGDLVRLPGLDPRFFGTVAQIEETASDSFQFVLFTLPVNINTLEWVEIAKATQTIKESL